MKLPIRSLILLSFCILSFTGFSQSQIPFNYAISIKPVDFPELPGLHSFAYAQHDSLWLVIGGRTDGIHARQPFNAFPEKGNNTNMYVINPETKQLWSATVSNLPTALKEQLQAANVNFYQDNDTLYILGGYAFSSAADDHITFPYLTSVSVSSLVKAIQNKTPAGDCFKQITREEFAVTGGHFIKLGSTFYLVGGQRFDGRYNPMGMGTYVQNYTNQIRKFTINNNGSQLSIADYSAITDPVHLRRRDYNLLPQIFPDGEKGFTISSGVFQPDVDLPYMYPVDIKANDYLPATTFNQYLSNYHGAFSCVYDSVENRMHNLFFGGIGYYFSYSGTLMMDNLLPFVKTVSRLSRSANGTLQEYIMPVEMPSNLGTVAAFIPNPKLKYCFHDVLSLNENNADTIMLGHIYGGIQSQDQNPFNYNQTELTSASKSLFEVFLIKSNATQGEPINGINPYKIKAMPLLKSKQIEVQFTLNDTTGVKYFVTNTLGEMIDEGKLTHLSEGINRLIIPLHKKDFRSTLQVTLVFDNKYFVTEKIVPNSLND